MSVAAAAAPTIQIDGSGISQRLASANRGTIGGGILGESPQSEHPESMTWGAGRRKRRPQLPEPGPATTAAAGASSGHVFSTRCTSSSVICSTIRRLSPTDR